MLTKPRDLSKTSGNTMSSRRKRRFSPFMLIGAAVTMLIALIGVGFFAYQQLSASHAAATANPNCTLVVPPNPLSATGLATPYQLVATNAGNGPCNEANANQSAFVQADILDPQTGQISAYEPLVIDQGTTPAIQPVAPNLPRNAVVAIWFGFNGTFLTLQNNAHTRGHGQRFHFMLSMRGGSNGNCVNGLANSPFGQFGYCNAPNFFMAANRAIQAGQLKVPALGTATDGKPCFTTRDFGMVDMDQSDNVQTQYLVNGNGQTAQFSTANQNQLQNATTIANPSDNALLTKFLDPALGCTPWTVPDLVNPGTPTATYGTDELMAAADQQAPIALVPGGDEMVLVNGTQNLTKVNLYRAGADQTPAASLTGTAATDANTTTYCQNLVNIALPRLQLDMTIFQNQPSPDGGVTATTLFGFLANRLNATLGPNGLNCTGLLNIQNPVALTTNGNGVVTSATITTTPLPANATATATTTTTTTGTTTTTTTNTATGTVNAILNTNAGTAQISTNINIANFANQTFFVNVTDSATGTQLLHQMENTDANGANVATTTINNLNIAAIPNTWVATITDANGNMLGSANFVSNGATAVATLTATSTGTTSTGTTTTTATPTATTTGNNNNNGFGNHHHHHHG
jgi:hypothetical protein